MFFEEPPQALDLLRRVGPAIQNPSDEISPHHEKQPVSENVESIEISDEPSRSRPRAHDGHAAPAVSAIMSQICCW